MADDVVRVGMRHYNANPDLYLMTQVQPRHGVNWAAHGRWVKVPGPFLPPGDARTYGWSRGLRITRPEGWHRRLRDRNERAAPLMATYVDEPGWFNYLTVPLVVPVTRDGHAGTDGDVHVPDVPPPHGLGVRTLPHAEPGLQEEVRGLRHDPRHLLCLLYTSPSPRDGLLSRMPSSA